uniref:G protein-regulated inducer of neurite outgrowth C-terminal domain-containing protein n=1 Tax=Oryzias latipes TaxID=8090 RepID=A0A3P9IYE7_ORYLA
MFCSSLLRGFAKTEFLCCALPSRLFFHINADKMGSLKNETKGLMEEHQLCEKTDDGERQVNSKQNSAGDGRSCQEDNQPELFQNTNSEEDTVKNAISKEVLSEEKGDKDEMPWAQQPAADEATATKNNITISKILPSEGEAQDTGAVFECESDAATDSISLPVPLTPDASDPRSPAPFGQNHIRTQVSLEVVQCRSAATSPMTPPQGESSFFFPSTFGKSDAGGDAKDAGLQVGQQVEFCSVATSPMTPKTPFATAFPALVGKETVQMKEKEKNGQEQSNNSQQVVSIVTSQEEVESQKTNAVKMVAKDSDPVSSGSPGNARTFLTAGSRDSKGTVENSNQQNKQQRMGSMDQDITILVTHHGNNEDEDEEKADTYVVESETIKVDECEEGRANKNDEKSTDEKTHDTSDPEQKQKQAKEEGKPCMRAESLEVTERKDACEETADASPIKSPIPESPAPFGCHNIRTQVSLEVVQCQSAATSPMTPPEGDQAFCFPSSFGKFAAVCTETKDAELQVGHEVEFRSVATAPMTPRTPIATTFPDIKRGVSIEEKITEEEEKKEPVTEDEKGEQVNKDEKAEDEEEKINCENTDDEKCEEPVQEVSWDEKGMTWEVYGAVVEVAVLGSAIQKHLEKQVKKQKRQTSLPPPPPLNPSATPLTTELVQGGSGKGCGGKRREDRKVNRRRRNPFRQLMENMQQPHCCSRAHTTE